MKKLALFLLFGVMPAFGQVYNATALQKMTGNWIQAVPFAQIKVCTSAATGNPCSPLATVYTDQALTNVINQTVNPITADAFGNYTFFVQPGTYLVCVNGASTSHCDYISTGGFSCGTAANPGLPIWNGTACVLDTNATDDGNGNLAAVSLTVGTLSTTGVGYTQVFQSQAAPDATFRNNMLAGQMVWFGNSGTGKWDCQNKDGTSCVGGVAAWSGVTSGTNSNAGTFAATGNTWDFTGVTQFRLRTGAGLTTSATGGIGFDTTNSMWHVWNGADAFLFPGSAGGTYTDGTCAQFANTAGKITLASSGGACGGSGSASLIPFSCGAAVSATVTDFCGFGNLNTSEANSQSPVSRAGTVSNLQCRIGGAGLSSTQTITIMVRKGSAGIGAILSADTTLTCTLNSTNSQGCSDGTHSFAVVAGDTLNIRTVPLNSPAIGVLTCSAQF